MFMIPAGMLDPLSQAVDMGDTPTLFQRARDTDSVTIHPTRAVPFGVGRADRSQPVRPFVLIRPGRRPLYIHY